MTIKNIFDDEEANAYFRRNNKKSGERQADKPISLLCDWLRPFKNEISELLDIGCGNGHELHQLSEGINVKILSSTDNEPDRFDDNLLAIISAEYVRLSLSISFANNS